MVEGSIDNFIWLIQEDACEGCLLYFHNHKELLRDENYSLVYKVIRYLFVRYRFPRFSIYRLKEEFEKRLEILGKDYRPNDESIYKPIINSLVLIINHHSEKGGFFDPLDQIL